MFSETRYALNGDLRVAYRASREGPRDIVLVPHWFFCCELLPELPSLQGWVEAMTSLGRLTLVSLRKAHPVQVGVRLRDEQLLLIGDRIGNLRSCLPKLLGRVEPAIDRSGWLKK